MQFRLFSPLSLLSAVILAGSGVLLSCGGGGTPSVGSISLSVSPTSASVQQGGSVQVTGTITRSGGFTGTVAFAATVSGNPAGLSGSVGTISTSGTVSTATITLSTTSATPAGTYTITVTGTGSGVTSSSATFTLTVTAAPAGSYTLSLNPTSLSISQGSNGTVTVNINRTNFTGGVTMTAENLPSGVTASFSPPSPVTANSTTLTLTASATATTGTSNITIRGSTPGQSPEGVANAIADQTVTLSLTVNVTSSGSFTLSASPATLSLAQGGVGTTTININRTGGFAASVALTVTGQVANMTATLNPTSTTTNSSTLTVNTTAGVAAGNVTLTITGTSGSITQTTTVTVTITAAGSFTLSATPATLNFAQGAGGTSTININRTGGFAGNVALTVTGQIANLTATLNPTGTTGNTSTLTVTTTAGVVTGTVTLTITGTSGSITQTTTVAVTVTSTGGGGNVTVDFSACTTNGRAIWFAGLNGTTWTQVTGANNVYSFTVNQSKGGYAYVTQNGSSFSTVVIYMTQAELTAGTITVCGVVPPAGKTVTGTVTGFGGGLFTSVNIAFAGAFASATPAQPNFTLSNAADGANDLLAWRSDLIAGPSASDRGLFMRGINPPNNTSVGTLDMAGGSSFAAATATATITGLVGGETITGGMSYAVGAACRIATLYSFLTGSASQPMFGVPAAQQMGTDFHAFNVLTSSGTPPAVSGRTHTEVFHTLADRTIALAPNYTGTVSIVTAPYKALQVASTIPAAYQNSPASLTYFTQDGSKSVVVTASQGWIGGSNLVMGFADLTAQGYQALWATTGTVNYTAAVAGFVNFTSSFCAEGAITRTAFFGGQI